MVNPLSQIERFLDAVERLQSLTDETLKIDELLEYIPPLVVLSVLG